MSAAVQEFITERARVLRVEAGIAWVSCESQAGCARCAAGQGCGGGIFSKLLRGRLEELPVPTDLALAPGDFVLIGLAQSAVQNASLLLYGLPLAGVILGALGGWLLGASDPATFLGLAAGFAAGLLLARRGARRLAGSSSLQPVLLRKLAEGEPCSAGPLA